jgi:hypothetical protein
MVDDTPAVLLLSACTPGPEAKHAQVAAAPSTPSVSSSAWPVLPGLDPPPVEVGLRDLLPARPPIREASTFELGDLAVPPGGVRESQRGVEVRSREVPQEVDGIERGGGVYDGLFDGARTLLPAGPTPVWKSDFDAAVREWKARCPNGCDDFGWAQSRVVRIAHVDDAHVSAWVGESEYFYGAAHSNNTLTCGTWDRRTGARLTLRDVLHGETEARLAALRAVEAEDLRDIELPGPENDSFLLVDGPIVCAPVSIGPGGASRLVRL